jgi:ABC-type polar amino acid transport system ATPase subunit
MIVIRGLKKSFAEREVIAGVDAQIGEGKIVAVLGASGSGKSTLLRCLNGLTPFDAGSIEIAGDRLAPGQPDQGLLRRLRSRVGMVFQEFHLFPHLSVLDNVTLAPRLVKGEAKRAAEARALRLLEGVGLADRAAAYPSQLSGGQKQRVAIVRALAQEVKVLLLDEPTSALDPDLREEVREVLRQVARGLHGESSAISGAAKELTMVLVTHERKLALELADEAWIFDRGTIASRGAPRDVVQGV